jgi:hypothetical protein
MKLVRKLKALDNRMPQSDKQIISEAINKHGLISIAQNIAEIIEVDEYHVMNQDLVSSFIEFLRMANGKLYTKMMFRLAILANSEVM